MYSEMDAFVMFKFWSLGVLVGLISVLAVYGDSTSSIRFKRQTYGNYGYGNNINTNPYQVNNPATMEYYHHLWDMMHDPGLEAAPPPMDPYAPPPPDPAWDEWAHRMGLVADPAPPPDPALDEWAHRMGWITDPAPPPDPAFDEWAHRMGWITDPTPPPDPAFEEWAHRMGWIADPAPPPDPAMDDYLRRLHWEQLGFDPNIQSELFHGFGFMPYGWAYEHYIPQEYEYLYGNIMG